MRHHPSRHGRSIALVIPLLVAACGTTTASPSPSASSSAASGSPSPAPSIAPSASPSIAPSSSPATGSAFLLQVASEGGFINPSATLAALPIVIVYADGRILTQGPPPANVTDPLLPTVEIRDLGPSAAAAIEAAIRTAGLDTPSTAEPGVSADSGLDVFTVPADGSLVTTRFAANGPGGPGRPGQPGASGPGASVDPERGAALDLLAKLLDPAETWGSDAASDTIYVPTAYRVFAAPLAPQTGQTKTVAWPLSTPLATFGTPAVPDRGVAGLRSGVVLGADAATLGPTLAAASTGTAFTSGGTAYTLWVRPLLPHELPG